MGTAASNLSTIVVAATGSWNSDTLHTLVSSSTDHQSGQSLTCRRPPDPVTDDLTRTARMPPSLLGGGTASGGLGAAAPSVDFPLGMPRSLLRGNSLQRMMVSAGSTTSPIPT